MKNKLLPIVFVLSFYSAYSQVIIGKKELNLSSQLEVFAEDKGVLFPRVALTSLTDTNTIVEGNVNSLFVFNTTTATDLKPGYYYWYIDKWNKITTSDEITVNTTADKGVPGDKGQPGYPGSDVMIYTDIETGTVYIQQPDGTWIKINGKNGKDGSDGKSITSALIDENGNLVLKYTDGTTNNAGKVKGDAGSNGDKGLDGKGGGNSRQ